MSITACKECGAKVSTLAKACPSCGARPKRPPKPRSRFGGFVALIFVFFVTYKIVGGLLSGAAADKVTEPPKKVSLVADSSQTPKQRSDQHWSEWETVFSLMPADERNFIAVVETAKSTYETGANDMQKGATRSYRSKLICKALSSRDIIGWKGRIQTLSSNGDGKGVLSVQISPNVYVKTWNNALSDLADKTLIDPDGPVYPTVSALKKGQWASFSGQFTASADDCVREASVTLNGSMTEPEFIMRFTSASAY